MFVGNNNYSTRRNIPNHVWGVPIDVREREAKYKPECDLKQYFYDPLPANVKYTAINQESARGQGQWVLCVGMTTKTIPINVISLHPM